MAPIGPILSKISPVSPPARDFRRESLDGDLDRVLRRATRRPLFEADSLVSTPQGRDHIERILPHRGAMLLLDSVEALDVGEGRAVGRRLVPRNDPAFSGHFPRDPIYPASLLVEMAVQLGLVLAAVTLGCVTADDSKVLPVRLRLVRVRDALFTGDVVPGDELTVLAMRVEESGHTWSAVGQVLSANGVMTTCAFDAVVPRATD